MTRDLAYWADRVADLTDQLVDATIHRDSAILAMRAKGASLRQIAEVAGISHGMVAKIVAR